MVATAATADLVMDASPAGSRARTRRLVRIAIAVALVGVELALVAPHFSQGGAALADLRWGWVVAAIACEVASIATFVRLRRSLLRAGGMQVRWAGWARSRWRRRRSA